MLKSFVAALFAVVVATGNAFAQDPAANFPSKAIRFIVAFAPGGGTDILARLVANQLSRNLGQPVVVENRAGASGAIAAQATISAEPDGYTLMVGGSGPMVFNPIVMSKMPYDPEALVPVTIFGSYPIVISARSDLPIKTLADLIKLAKEKPGALNYGSAAVSFQVPAEYFAQRAGIKLQVVPYKGTGPAVAAIMAGDIELIMADMAPAVGLLKSGRVRALAVTTAKRNPVIPDVPTVAESGIPGFDASLFSALVAPAKTPPAIVRKLQQEVAKVLTAPEIKERLDQLGVEPGGMSPEATAARIKKEIATYAPIAEAAGVRQ